MRYEFHIMCLSVCLPTSQPARILIRFLELVWKHISLPSFPLHLIINTGDYFKSVVHDIINILYAIL